ncbi:DNA binding domain-containing protein, excisionase family [Actinomadura mexicana]|uniref:DNA binding domain-containing protein, excisionase family n=1 Tax=Actinomadura mexicana TaxID=134959 RepID=A0A239HGJ1_9ACTN|nr:DNA binding domain-containing protein, excisionase family [Actinomadura mexicana]
MTTSDQAVKDALRADFDQLANDIYANTDMDQVKAQLYAAMRQRPPLPAPPPEPPTPLARRTGERPLSDVRFLTVAEVAAIMRVSKMTVYRLTHSGELPAIRVGRSFRIPEQAVYDYLRDAYERHQAM